MTSQRPPKHVFLLHGGFRSGKTHACKLLAQELDDAEIVDVDDVRPSSPPFHIGQVKEIQQTIKDTIAESKKQIIVFCGASIVFAERTNGERLKAPVELFDSKIINHDVVKLYLDPSPRRVFENIILSRLETSPTSSRTDIEVQFEKIIGFDRGEDLPSTRFAKFREWYDSVTSRQALSAGSAKESRRWSETLGYTRVTEAEQVIDIIRLAVHACHPDSTSECSACQITAQETVRCQAMCSTKNKNKSPKRCRRKVKRSSGTLCYQHREFLNDAGTMDLGDSGDLTDDLTDDDNAKDSSSNDDNDDDDDGGADVCHVMDRDVFSSIFRLYDNIGSGTFGSVGIYDVVTEDDNQHSTRAPPPARRDTSDRQILHGDRVVVKIMKPSSRQSVSRLRKLFRKEVSHLHDLWEDGACKKHGVLCMLSCFELRDKSQTVGFAVVSPLRNHAMSLHTWINNHAGETSEPLHILQTCLLLRQIVDSVAYIHSAGVVHVDLKPQNILVYTDAQSGRLRTSLLDFGAACHWEDHTCLRTSGGTIPYLPPEWFARRMQSPDEPVAFTDMAALDVFSLGLTMFNTLTVQEAFTLVQEFGPIQRQNSAAFGVKMSQFRQWKAASREAFGTVSLANAALKDKRLVDLVDLIRGMTSLDVSTRIPDAEQSLQMLDKAMEGVKAFAVEFIARA